VNPVSVLRHDGPSAFKMRFQTASVLTAALSLVASSNAIKIILNNDDGFGSGNLRELYRFLKEDGHDGMRSSVPNLTRS
jgi:hypothetical protein